MANINGSVIIPLIKPIIIKYCRACYINFLFQRTCYYFTSNLLTSLFITKVKIEMKRMPLFYIYNLSNL